METIQKCYLLFIMYAFLGWCIETTRVSIQNKKFVNRGFLIGPYCSIYGFGAIIITVLLNRYTHNPLILFIMAIIISGILEYFTSLAMEKIFKARWWDYSDRKFNINGRICLSNLGLFGVLGLIIIYLVNPFLVGLIDKLNENQLVWISTIIAIIYIIDVIISFIVIGGFRKATRQVSFATNTDNTEQITKMVRQVLGEKSFLHRRFINAYPSLQAIRIKIKKIKNKVDDTKENIKQATEVKKKELQTKIEIAQYEAKQRGEQRQKQRKIRLYLGKKYLKNKFKRP